jgi:hypothetical protein
MDEIVVGSVTTDIAACEPACEATEPDRDGVFGSILGILGVCVGKVAGIRYKAKSSGCQKNRTAKSPRQNYCGT